MGKASRRKKEQQPANAAEVSKARRAWSEDVRTQTRASVKAFWQRSPTPESLVHILTQAYNAADVNIGGVYQSIAQAKLKVDCAKGCSFCCHTEVTVTAPEVLALRNHIEQTFTEEQKQELRSRLKERNQQAKAMADEEKATSRRACPLLVEGTCSAYTARPFYCRLHHSQNVSACRKVADGWPGSIPVIAEFGGVTVPILEGLKAAFQESGCRIEPLWLSEALELALDVEPQEWCGGGDPFAAASNKAYEESLATLSPPPQPGP